jgi:type II secretory pathway component GspD/PulD (secretin)
MCTIRSPARSWLEMYLSRSIRSALFAVLATLAVQAAGQHGLEIISLRHRTAEQVLPALRPLMEPGATLTGQGTQLIVRASPANLDELRRALAAIDRPLRRLQISVRFDDALDAAAQGVEAGGRVGNRGARIDVRAHQSHRGQVERVDQRIQVLEGGRAFISTGQSTAILHGTAIREAASGFEAVARLAGNTVFLDIGQRRETLAQQQALSTTVSGRLGEWFEIGSAVEQASRDDRGIASRTAGRSLESRRTWLKVEEIRP